MKYTLISAKYKFDISKYLDRLDVFTILKENFKMFDFDNEEAECIKYKIIMDNAEDFMSLRNILNNDIIVQDDFYDVFCNIIKEPTILIHDGYIE